ncbi:MAG TPA: hypothetical protein QGG27_07305, partial [Acidimicrobiales bacterium]|nr:hypothetical protein [Acidimicrobiales bacterium]
TASRTTRTIITVRPAGPGNQSKRQNSRNNPPAPTPNKLFHKGNPLHLVNKNSEYTSVSRDLRV